MNIKLTSSLILVLGLLLNACSSNTPAPTATILPTTTATNTITLEPTITPTITLTPTSTPKPTVTPNLAATQQYEEFFGVVQDIFDAGQIDTTDGRYVQMDDYKDEIQGKLSYSWADENVEARNFIVQADFEWSSTFETTNLSGCGFVFRLQPNGDHYLILLDRVQGVKLASHTDRGTYSMGSPTNGKGKISSFGSNPYHATFTFVVTDLKAYVYVNDIYYGEYKLLDYRITDSGPFSGAVLSAEDYASTNCSITNTQAWIMDD